MGLSCNSPSHSPLFFSSSFRNWIGKLPKIFTYLTVSLLRNLFSAILTLYFALVGSLLGAMIGALIGQKAESGFFRGTAIGALSGAVFSLEVYESSLVLWQTNEPRTSCLLLIDVTASLLSGRLIRERVSTAVQNAVQRQIVGSETFFEDVFDVFDTYGVQGLSANLVERIPEMVLTTNDSVEKTSCAVCLQDFEVGEVVRRLPNCYHMFHLPCIDKWLVKHGSCPLCRSNLLTF